MMNRKGIFLAINSLLDRIMPKDAKVFLFGSQARGDYSEQSDWDLLIILDTKDNISVSQRGDITFPIYQLAAEIGIEINPIVYTAHEWEKRSFTPFYKNVLTDRVRLWG